MNSTFKYIKHVKNNGFTLIEVILSLVLVSILVISFFSIIIFINTSTINSNEIAVKNNIIINILENLKRGNIYSEISNIDKEELENSGITNFNIDKYQGKIETKFLEDNNCYMVMVYLSENTSFNNSIMISTIVKEETFLTLFN